MKQILETERLRLRELNQGDTGFIIALLNSPGWLQYIGNRNIKTRDQALTYLENGPFKSYRENGFGLNLVERKSDGAAIGMCGILKREDLQYPDIGFAFFSEFQGMGYAFEIARATLTYAREELGMKIISAITIPGNTRSIQLLEKLGLRRVGTFSFPQNEETLLLFNNACHMD
ncbi:MAG TPA: GNAT family N-acetyltransferase [Sphingobacteriaceae bacterium]